MKLSNLKPFNMKYFLTMIATILCVAAVAQKKPSLSKAKSALDKGELAEAKTIIDAAILYEKTKDKAKTWYYRGLVYVSLDTINQEPGAMKTAMDSFNKALEIDPEQKTTTEFVGGGIQNVDTQIQAYYGFYYNRAVAGYQQEDFVKAADNFEYAYFIVPTDTSAALNAAYAAAGADDHERAKKNFQVAVDKGMKEISVFLRLYNYAVQAENLDEALEILDAARKIHPNEISLEKFRINILIQQDRVDEAKASIESAIAKEPDNADLHFSLGVIKEETDDEEGAQASYRQAIGIDESHYNSNFNLGVLMFNVSNSLIKERNDLGYREVKKYDELTKKINDSLTEALPFWEKLYSLKQDEESILETLKYIYVNLDMNDKAEKMADELDALKG